MEHTQSSDAEVIKAFRDAMRGMANSVVMVTTWMDGRPWGLTVSACCSVSATPPMLLVSIGAHTVTAQTMRESRYFGVNILSERQIELAHFGARPQAPKFCHDHCEDFTVTRGRAPIIKSAVAHFCCRLEREVVAADHVICIGAVESVTRSVSDRPLLHYEREFHRLREEPIC
jgi:flavin reductase ActVB